MCLAARLLRSGAVLFAAWSSICELYALGCGECQKYCDDSSGLCFGNCKYGWKGTGCYSRCSPNEDCRNPCRCQIPCRCNTQFMTCSRTCMASENAYSSVNDESVSKFILTLSCIAIVFGLLAICCFFWRKSSHGLRGRVLSHPLCARCPVFRDCIQRIGLRVGLRGFQLGARDSLESLGEEDERNTATYSQRLRQWRRGKPTVVGVRVESAPIKASGTSGFKWKKKWRERKKRSRMKRKQKHAERKMRKEGVNPEERRGSIILPPLDRLPDYHTKYPNTRYVSPTSSMRSPLSSADSFSIKSPSGSLGRRGSSVPCLMRQNSMMNPKFGEGGGGGTGLETTEYQGITVTKSSKLSKDDTYLGSVDPINKEEAKDAKDSSPSSPPPRSGFLRHTKKGSDAEDESTSSIFSREQRMSATAAGAGGSASSAHSSSEGLANSAVAKRVTEDVARPDTWTTPVEVISELTEVVVTKPSDGSSRQPDS